MPIDIVKGPSGEYEVPDNGLRQQLTAPRTYFVRTDGNDGNTGLVNSAAGAWLTLQNAIDVVSRTLDLAGNVVTIQVGAGTYTAGCGLSAMPPIGNGGSIVMQGDLVTPGNVVVNPVAGNCFGVSNGSVLTVQGFRVVSPANGVSVASLSTCYLGAMEYGACVGNQINVTGGALVLVTADYAISGGGAIHVQADIGSRFQCNSRTITLSGTPAYSVAFAYASSNSAIYAIGNTFPGTGATGTRYSVSVNGSIQTGGGGPNYFPGNVAGVSATGGQYV